VNILYLEDNPDDALLTQRALSKAVPPITVDVVHTLADAFKSLGDSASNYDLVLSDLNLPDGSGFSLLNFIRSSPQAGCYWSK
jgi:CheY-like chemotaxis protein